MLALGLVVAVLVAGGCVFFVLSLLSLSPVLIASLSTVHVVLGVWPSLVLILFVAPIVCCTIASVV